MMAAINLVNEIPKRIETMDTIDGGRCPTSKGHEMNFDKWKTFSEWVHCVCVITFDLELGQAMEFIYPEHIRLSEQEKTNICYLAFPDSNSGCMGDTQFHIRLRVAPGTPDTLLNSTHRRFNSQCLPVQRADTGHYWGFVYFRQTKDSSLPRGYFQKSFIILTRLPFFNLFYEICSLIAPRYFTDGLPILQSACEQISMWPHLKAGNSLTLNLLGTVFQTYIPKTISSHATNRKTSETGECGWNCNRNMNRNRNRNRNSGHSDQGKENVSQEEDDDDDGGGGGGDHGGNDDHAHVDEMEDAEQENGMEQQHQEEGKRTVITGLRVMGPTLPPQVLASVHEIDIFRSLSSVISHVHLLWELVLIAEPIVVMGPSPTDCSHMVQSLISMIAPLAYCAESRPYFTIHDSEFKEFTQRVQGPPSIIIGVTNPFFTKPLENWPHLIRLAEQTGPSIPQPGVLLSGGMPNYANCMTTVNSTKLRKVKAFNSKLLDNSPGVYTKYKPFLQKDKGVIKKILHGLKTKRPQSVQSALLRRHLLELTQSFMIPLERYIASLMPLQKDISPFKAAPNPNQFKQDDFLASLDHSGPHLTSPLRGDWKGLYKRFFRSPNFKGWYETRDLELRQTLQGLQLQALSDADLNKWAQGKHEVEIVDMILKLKQKLKMCSESQGAQSAGNGGSILRTTTRNQLMKHLENMKQSLPDDLKTILNDT